MPSVREHFLDHLGSLKCPSGIGLTDEKKISLDSELNSVEHLATWNEKDERDEHSADHIKDEGPKGRTVW